MQSESWWTQVVKYSTSKKPTGKLVVPIGGVDIFQPSFNFQFVIELKVLNLSKESKE